MYIRCLDCQSSTWIETLEPGAHSNEVSCQSCGRDYSLHVPENLGGDPREQYKKALAFAEENGVDLPSAYSVLLRIMTLDEARGLGDRPVGATAREATARVYARREALRKAEAAGPAIRPPKISRTPPERPARPAPPMPTELPYDPGFRRAVAAGTLTVRQATERGNREAMARRLSQAQGLSMRLAYDVLDNRVSLRKALNMRPLRKAPRSDEEAPKPVSRGQKTFLVVTASIVVALVALGGTRLWSGFVEEARELQTSQEARPPRDTVAARSDRRPTPNAAVAPSGDPALSTPEPDVRRDESGRVVLVSGPDPQTVLIRFCQTASETNRFEPVELTPTVPPFAGSRLGLMRDFDRLDSLFAIQIRREPDSRRWSAGNGRGPIVPQMAPQIPPGVERIPVEAVRSSKRPA